MSIDISLSSLILENCSYFCSHRLLTSYWELIQVHCSFTVWCQSQIRTLKVLIESRTETGQMIDIKSESQTLMDLAGFVASNCPQLPIQQEFHDAMVIIVDDLILGKQCQLHHLSNISRYLSLALWRRIEQYLSLVLQTLPIVEQSPNDNCESIEQVLLSINYYLHKKFSSDCAPRPAVLPRSKHLCVTFHWSILLSKNLQSATTF